MRIHKNEDACKGSDSNNNVNSVRGLVGNIVMFVGFQFFFSELVSAVRRLAVVVSVLCCVPCYAFDSREHREMGAAAIIGAIGFLESQHSTSTIESGLVAARALKNQYGALNECVDFFLYPEKILAFAWRPGAVGGINNASPSVLPDGLLYKLPEELLSSCKQGASWVQASHSNHAHFQQDLLVSMRIYHALAIGIAHDEQNTYGALVVNAIADHYLQDFFAPGHLVTPRDRLTDIAATAQHDLANQMGAIFRPRATGIQRVLEYLCGAPLIEVASNGSEQSCRPSPEAKIALQRIHMDPDIDNSLSSRISDIQAGRPVLFRGDGRLFDEGQATQRLLLLVVQIQSIVDVVMKSNLLKTMDYRYALAEGRPMAKTDFGRYDFDTQNTPISTLLANSEAPTDSKEPDSVIRGRIQNSVLSICSLGQCDDRTYKLRTRSPIFGLSFHRESQSSGVHQSRDVWSAEFSTVGKFIDLSRFSGNWLSGVEAVPVFGYSYFSQGQFTGSGPTVRLPFQVPETEVSAGPYIRWLKYSGPGTSARKLSWGIRADSGFSTYVTLYVGLGVDHGFNAMGSTQRTTVWSAGLRLGAPLTQLAVWK